MTSQNEKQSADGKAAGAAALLNNAYKAGMGAARTMHQTAIDIPLNILAQLGLEEDKVSALRAKSQELIGELYTAIDSVASKSGLVGEAKDTGPKAEKKQSNPTRADSGTRK